MSKWISEKPLLELYIINAQFGIFRSAFMGIKSRYDELVLRFARRAVVTLCDDLSLCGKDKNYLLVRLASEGFSFLSKTLPVLAKALESGLSARKFQCPTSFKRSGPRSALPAFLGSLFAKVFTVDGMLLSEASPEAVYAIRQLCYLFYKADTVAESRDSVVINSFLRTEVDLSNLNIVEDSSIRLSNRLISSLFRDFYISNCDFKHGPGVVSNLRHNYEKDTAPLSDIPSVWHHPTAFFFNEKDFWDNYSRLPHKSIFDFGNGYGRDSVSNCARVILVPKDSRGPRLISCEPYENQFLQQGIAGYMVRKLEGHPIYGGQINFTDQSVNRDLARIASLDQSYSTLDLKEASDRISVQLVQKLFEGRLLDSLMSTRSSFTELPDGRIVELLKFAPMGSACCFPVLATCVYFMCIAEISTGCNVPLQEAAKLVFVYGDDVIVKTEYVERVQTALTKVGLAINTGKSFVNSRFAESCGFDGFDGADVTPLRMKKSIHHTIDPLEVSHLIGSLDLANRMNERGLIRTAQFLYDSCEIALGVRLPFGSPDSPYLCKWHERGEEINLEVMSDSKVSFVDGHPVKPLRLIPVSKYESSVKLGIPTFRIKTRKVSVETDFYGHARRIANRFKYFKGVDLLNVSEATKPGEYPVRRDITLKSVVTPLDVA